MKKQKQKMQEITVTYSSLSTFLTCRYKYLLRTIDQLVPKNRNKNLNFGGIIHNSLDLFYSNKHESQSKKIAKTIADGFETKLNEDDSVWDHKENINVDKTINATAMMNAYHYFYFEKDFEQYDVVAVEELIEGKIKQPQSDPNKRSKSRHKMTFKGKIDGLLRRKSDGTFWLFEHKTAGIVDQSYLERLQGDLQIILYSVYLEEILGIKISGVLYNVLEKCKLKMGKGETEHEFEERYAALVAKSKTGKSSAKRKMPESVEEFYQRCHQWYTKSIDEMPAHFYRQEIVFTADQKRQALEELWNLTGHLRDAFSGKISTGNKRLNYRLSFYKNRTACNNFGLCSYWPLCNGEDDELTRELLYNVEEPFSELKENNGDIYALKKRIKGIVAGGSKKIIKKVDSAETEPEETESFIF